MNELAHSCIKRVYENKDYGFFKERSSLKPQYYDKLIELANILCKKILILNTENDPAIELLFYFRDYIKNEFHIKYKSLLKISKVADLFVFQHEFSVENRDEEGLTPVLEGFGAEPYISSQYKVAEKITEFLYTYHLQKLELTEIDEVVWGLKIPETSIFGTQMTVENALFRDLYGICEEKTK